MSSKILAIATAAFFLFLAAQLLFLPAMAYSLFELQPNEVSQVMSRRLGAGFLGLAAMCFLMRNAEASSARRAFAAGLVVLVLTLASTGLYEALLGGQVGTGIWVAIAAELVIAFAWQRIARS